MNCIAIKSYASSHRSWGSCKYARRAQQQISKKRARIRHNSCAPITWCNESWKIIWDEDLYFINQLNNWKLLLFWLVWFDRLKEMHLRTWLNIIWKCKWNPPKTKCKKINKSETADRFNLLQFLINKKLSLDFVRLIWYV